MRSYPDDPDVLARPADDLPLWRQAPASVGTEQRTLGDEKFYRWLGTADGSLVFAAFCDEVRRQVRDGEKVSAKFAWEVTRRLLKRNMDNRHHAIAMREAERRYPELRGKAEKRRSKKRRVKIDNRFTSVVARRLVDRYPELRDVIELRKRGR